MPDHIDFGDPSGHNALAAAIAGAEDEGEIGGLDGALLGGLAAGAGAAICEYTNLCNPCTYGFCGQPTPPASPPNSCVPPPPPLAAPADPGAGNAAASDTNNQYSKAPSDAKDPNGAKAPGKPGEAEGFKDPKSGEKWGKAPNGKNGWVDDKGNAWVPSGRGGAAHGGPHWDVQKQEEAMTTSIQAVT